MKILFIGVFTEYSTSLEQSRGLKALDHTVIEYDFKKWEKVLGNSKSRDEHLKREIDKIKPDLCIFAKCSKMSEKVVQHANKYGKSVFWYMDATHNIDKSLIQKVKESNIVLCGLYGVVDKLKQYNTNTFFLEQCPDSLHNFKINKIEKIYDVTFIGNISGPIHSARNTYLLRNKDKCKIKWFKNRFGLDHNRIVNQTKININISPSDLAGGSVRVHKILAAGGFLMTTPWTGIEHSFTPGEHLVVFDSVEDFQNKSKYYLENKDERERIAEQGRQLVLSKYMGKEWASKLLLFIKEQENDW